MIARLVATTFFLALAAWALALAVGTAIGRG